MDDSLPHNHDSERSLIGSIFLRNDIVFDVMEIVAKADFHESFNGELFDLCKDHIGANRIATAQTLMPDINQDRVIDSASGMKASEYMAGLAREGVTAGLALELAKGIRNTSLLRRLITTAEQLASDARSAPVSIAAEVIRDKYDTAFRAFFPSLSDLGVKHIAQYGDMVLDDVYEAARGATGNGLGLGLAGCEEKIGPLMPGRLYLLAGAAGAGKSALVMQWLRYITRGQSPELQKIGLIFQAEMPGEEVARRELTRDTGIPGYAIEVGAGLTNNQIQQLVDANNLMRPSGLHIEAGTTPSVSRIAAKAMRMKRSIGIDLAVIDHVMYLENPDPKAGEVAALWPNLRGLKTMAKDLAIPVVALMPLKGTFAAGEVRRPTTADLFNPAAVDANADVIAFIHNPEYMLKRNEPAPDDPRRQEWELKCQTWAGKAELLLAKRRGGKGYGVAALGWDERLVAFTDNAVRPPLRIEGDLAF